MASKKNPSAEKVTAARDTLGNLFPHGTDHQSAGGGNVEYAGMGGAHYPAQGGMATGRPVPRRSGPSEANLIEMRHDLQDPGDIDMRQGRLFSPGTLSRATLSDAEMSRRTGVPTTPDSSAPGFLPRVGHDSRTGHKSVAEARQAARSEAVSQDLEGKANAVEEAQRQVGLAGRRKGKNGLREAKADLATHQQNLAVAHEAVQVHVRSGSRIAARKLAVIQRHGQEIGPTGRDPSEPDRSNPISEAIKRRLDYDSPDTSTWYTHGAPAAIAQAAQSTNSSYGQVRRGVSQGSPQMPWDSGHPQDGTYRMNNVQFASDMAHHVKSNQFRMFGGNAVTPTQAGDTFRSVAYHEGRPAPGRPRSAVQSATVRTKTAHAFMGDDPSAQISSDSQKVPNFDAALNRNNPSRWARRQAARAFTVDTHDEHTQGISSKYAWSGATNPGGYDISTHTGRRAATKSGKLPADFQATIWSNVRNDTVSSAAKQQTMFRPGKNSKGDRVERVNKSALP